MSNQFRQFMPLLHRAKVQLISDPITYKRQSLDPIETTASPIGVLGIEAEQFGNNLQIAMSSLQLGALVPQIGDEVTWLSVDYKVTDVRADDYGSWNLSLRRK